MSKGYVPTGGDLVMRRLRRHPERRWVTSSLQSLWQYERRTRLNELIHLIGFIGFTVLAASKFASGSLTVLGLTFALALNLIFGLWPVCPAEIQPAAPLPGHKDTLVSVRSPATSSPRDSGSTRIRSDMILGG